MTNEPYRGFKGDTYEGGVRVPCVMRWPGRIKAGSTVNEMLHMVDLYPTLLRLGGGPPQQPLPLDGRDAWPTITQGKPTPHSEIVLSVPGLESSETGPPAIRVGNFKLVGDELYNIAEDPSEKNNIASTQPDKVRTLRTRLDELARERRPPEKHDRISEEPLWFYGEEENKAPVPEWVKTIVAKNAAAPESQTAKKAAKKKKK